MFQDLPSGERYLYGLFSLIENGFLTVVNPDGKQFQFGNPDAPHPLTLTIRNPKTYDRVLSFGSLGFGEAYMDGWYDTPDLQALMDVIMINNDSVGRGFPGQFLVRT